MRQMSEMNSNEMKNNENTGQQQLATAAAAASADAATDQQAAVSCRLSEESVFSFEAWPCVR